MSTLVITIHSASDVVGADWSGPLDLYAVVETTHYSAPHAAGAARDAADDGGGGGAFGADGFGADFHGAEARVARPWRRCWGATSARAGSLAPAWDESFAVPADALLDSRAVSYTHLTLPTKRIV